MLKVMSIFGTRPEAIKMAPVVAALDSCDQIESMVCVTAQHREMLDSVLDFFSIVPDFDLDVMAPNQPLNTVLGKMLIGLEDVLRKSRPDIVLVQGDTASCLAGAIAAFNLNIPVGHIEAGLRTYDLEKPYPEEGNRQMASRISHFHFASTQKAADNLKAERIPEENIVVTGNTVIDAVLMAVDLINKNPDQAIVNELPHLVQDMGPFILLTGHRRESFGRGFENICNALEQIARSHPDLAIIYPVHLNPNVQGPVNHILGGLSNVHLIPPQSYPAFINLMQNCKFILTDSGGVQEEAPSLNKPVLVMRDVTERPEAVEGGAALLVGTEAENIISAVGMLLCNQSQFDKMANAKNPFGDGKAAERICRYLMNLE